MQVFLPFTGNAEATQEKVVEKKVTVDFGDVVIQKEKSQIDSHINVYQVNENKLDMPCPDNTSTTSINTQVSIKKTEHNTDISVANYGLKTIDVIKGVFEFNSINYINEVKIDAKQQNILSEIIKKETSINADIPINKKEVTSTSSIIFNKITSNFESAALINKVSQFTEQFQCANESKAELEVSINKKVHNTIFDDKITKNELSLIGSVKNGIGYIVDEAKNSTINFVKGYNLITLPVFLYNQNIIKVSDFVKTISSLLNKEPYDLFAQVSTISGDKRTEYIVSEQYTTPYDSEKNFELFEISGDYFYSKGLEVIFKDDVVVNLINILKKEKK